MGCEETRDLIDELIDGELPPEAEAEVRAHVEQCAECRAVMERHSRAADLVRGLPRVGAPRDFSVSVREAIAADVGRGKVVRPAGGWRLPMWLTTALPAAACLMLAAILGVRVMQKRQAEGTDVTAIAIEAEGESASRAAGEEVKDEGSQPAFSPEATEKAKALEASRDMEPRAAEPAAPAVEALAERKAARGRGLGAARTRAAAKRVAVKDAEDEATPLLQSKAKELADKVDAVKTEAPAGSLPFRSRTGEAVRATVPPRPVPAARPAATNAAGGERSVLREKPEGEGGANYGQAGALKKAGGKPDAFARDGAPAPESRADLKALADRAPGALAGVVPAKPGAVAPTKARPAAEAAEWSGKQREQADADRALDAAGRGDPGIARPVASARAPEEKRQIVAGGGRAAAPGPGFGGEPEAQQADRDMNADRLSWKAIDADTAKAEIQRIAAQFGGAVKWRSRPGRPAVLAVEVPADRAEAFAARIRGVQTGRATTAARRSRSGRGGAPLDAEEETSVTRDAEAGLARAEPREAAHAPFAPARREEGKAAKGGLFITLEIDIVTER